MTFALVVMFIVVIFAGYKKWNKGTVFVWVDVLIIVQQCLFLLAFFSIEKYN